MKRSLFAALSIAAFAVLGVAGPAATLTGCDEVDEAVDCAKICNRYDECIGGEDYDEGACRERCEQKADDQEGFDDQADACESCIDGDESCVEQVFMCGTQCANIVP